jgi:hypothetical protein
VETARVRRALAYLVLGAGVAALYYRFLPLVGGFPVAPVDDTYIHLQYAKTLAHGHPFSYIAGEGYWTGATSILYVLLLAPFYLVGLSDAAVTWVALGVGAVSLGLTAWLASELAERATAGLLVLALGPIAFHSLSGMETGCYCAAILAVFLLALRRPERTSTLVALALLPLVRPDGIVFSAVAALLLVRKQGWRVGLVVVPTLLYYAVNRALTGDAATAGMRLKSWFSDPYMVPLETAAQVARTIWARVGVVFGAGHTPPVLKPWLFWVPLLGVVGLARRRTAILLVALVVGYLAINNTKANLHGWLRYFVPLYPLLLVGTARAFELARARAAVLALQAGAAAAVAIGSHPDWWRAFALEANEIRNKQVALALDIARVVPPGERVATIDAGAVALLGGHPMIDINGLVSPGTTVYGVLAVPGRVELMHALPPERRPRYAALYRTSLPPALVGKVLAEHRGFVLYEVNYAPLDAAVPPGTIDRVDVCDPISERDHAFAFAPRHWNDGMPGRAQHATWNGIVDAGRPVREESMVLAARPGEPATLVVRTTGLPRGLTVVWNGRRMTPTGTPTGWLELSAPIPAELVRARNEVRVEAPAEWLSFHTFVIQP